MRKTDHAWLHSPSMAACIGSKSGVTAMRYELFSGMGVFQFHAIFFIALLAAWADMGPCMGQRLTFQMSGWNDQCMIYGVSAGKSSMCWNSWSPGVRSAGMQKQAHSSTWISESKRAKEMIAVIPA